MSVYWPEGKQTIVTSSSCVQSCIPHWLWLQLLSSVDPVGQEISSSNIGPLPATLVFFQFSALPLHKKIKLLRVIFCAVLANDMVYHWQSQVSHIKSFNKWRVWGFYKKLKRSNTPGKPESDWTSKLYENVTIFPTILFDELDQAYMCCIPSHLAIVLPDL